MLQSDVITWILSNEIVAHHSQRVRCCAAYLIQQIALFCPKLILANNNVYINWVKSSFEKEHAKIILFLMQSVQNLYISSQGKYYIMDQEYLSFMNLFIQKTLERNFIAGGYSAAAQDSINDIT